MNQGREWLGLSGMSDTSTHGCMMVRRMWCTEKRFLCPCGARGASCPLCAREILAIDQSIPQPQNVDIRSKLSYPIGNSLIGHRNIMRLRFVCSARQLEMPPMGYRSALREHLHMPFQTIRFATSRATEEWSNCFVAFSLICKRAKNKINNKAGDSHLGQTGK